MSSEDVLRAHFEARVERAARAGRARPGRRAAGPVGAIAVLRDFTPETFVASAVAFARGTAGARAASWYEDFTRTIFLAGDPRNLAERHPCEHLSPDGTIAWFGPAPLADREPLRRLLRPFRGPLGVAVPFGQEMRIGDGDAPGRGSALLEVPAAGMSVEDYLIDVNHLIAEAVLDGLLSGTGRLLVRHLPDDPGASARHDRIRVTADPHSPGGLRARAYLTVE